MATVKTDNLPYEQLYADLDVCTWKSVQCKDDRSRGRPCLIYISPFIFQDIAWAENEDWKTPKYEYEDEDLDFASVRANWELVNNPELPAPSPVNAVNPNVLQQCNPDQANAVAVWQ